MQKFIQTAFFTMLLFSLGHGEHFLSMEKTAEMNKLPGFFNLYWEEQTGKIWMEIDKLDTPFLYQSSIAAGLGAVDLSLDRNRLGRTRVVHFAKTGPKILLIQKNYAFRADTDNEAVKAAVDEAFSDSVIWGFSIYAEDNGKYLVDASSFFLRDDHNVISIMKRNNQGDYILDESRSFFYLPRTKNFPLNTEVETMLTFSSKAPGRLTVNAAPEPGSVSIRIHHSLAQLPDNKYSPRVFDPRSGFLENHYTDFANPMEKPLLERYIIRFRLQKKNPRAEISDPMKPIVFYVEQGMPEPIRSAVMEGAKWWDEAFESIGFKNAFKVKLLPEDADPMDIRYNVITWVYRTTRSWSYAGMVWDPRTGEFIKANVVLEGRRAYTDYLIAQGLAGDFTSTGGNSPELKQMVLARIRQLACHEVGHILGLDHNFASSADHRSSVMDYPYPLVKLRDNGTINLSDAYDEGIGEWDKLAIEYGYQDFPEGVNEKEELQKILKKRITKGLHLLSNRDTVPESSPHPLSHRWDNGENPVDELERIMEIRKTILHNFSEKKIPYGTPMALLEDVLTPLYLFHRYQIVAVSKVIGGLYYNYSIRGDGQSPPHIASPLEQRKAIQALLQTIDPQNLAIEEKILQLIPPRPLGFPEHSELFPGHTGLTFDPIGAAETIAHLTIPLLLNPERAARMEEYHSRNPENPGFYEVLDELISFTWKSGSTSGYYAAIQSQINHTVLYHLINLAGNRSASSQVRAAALWKLEELKMWMMQRIDKIGKEREKAQYFFSITQINTFQENPDMTASTIPLSLPKSMHNPPLGELNN